MNDIQKNLTRYLEMEGVLNRFFWAFNYCFEHCIKKALEKSGGKPVAACCQNKYYRLYDLDHPAFDLLRAEREKRFGAPGDYTWPDPVSPCEYHNPAGGCVLTTHKSPVCLAFMCRESIEVLRERFGIYAYDYLGMHYALEWTLTGDFSDNRYRELRKSIQSMIATIETKRGGKIVKP